MSNAVKTFHHEGPSATPQPTFAQMLPNEGHEEHEIKKFKILSESFASFVRFAVN